MKFSLRFLFLFLFRVSASAAGLGFKEIEAITNKMKKEEVVFYKIVDCKKNDKIEKEALLKKKFTLVIFEKEKLTEANDSFIKQVSEQSNWNLKKLKIQRAEFSDFTLYRVTWVERNPVEVGYFLKIDEDVYKIFSYTDEKNESKNEVNSLEKIDRDSSYVAALRIGPGITPGALLFINEDDEVECFSN